MNLIIKFILDGKKTDELVVTVTIGIPSKPVSPAVIAAVVCAVLASKLLFLF